MHYYLVNFWTQNLLRALKLGPRTQKSDSKFSARSQNGTEDTKVGLKIYCALSNWDRGLKSRSQNLLPALKLGPRTKKLDRALKVLDRALKIRLKLGPSTQNFGPSTQNPTQIGTEHSKIGPRTQNGRDIIVPTLVLKYRSHFHPP